jgi:hypothetical protein
LQILVLDRSRLTLSDLPSFQHRANQCSCRDAYRKRRRNRYHWVPLDALSCVIQQFFGGITALLCGAPHYSYAILDRVGNCTGGARSLVSRFGNVFRRSFHYSL